MGFEEERLNNDWAGLGIFEKDGDAWAKESELIDCLIEQAASKSNSDSENTALTISMNTALERVIEDLSETTEVIDAIPADFLTELPLTDTGNAECFRFEYGKNCRYNKTTRSWFVWDGVVWKEDEKEFVNDWILQIVRKRQQAFTDSFNDKDWSARQRALNYMIRCEDVKYRKSIKSALEMMPDLITTIQQYNSDNYLIATQNGTLSLRSGKFYQSKREDYLTLQIGAEYNPEADCPRWKQFLTEVFKDDKELIDFIQKVVGYSLTGDTIEQLMFIFYGFGKNGKSVFINTIQALLGDYAGTASFKTFDADKRTEQTNDLAILKGKRFVSMSESGAERKLNEPLIKQVTGGDKISCRLLFKENFEYVPQFKLFLATNHKPIISQSDFGIWRRLVLIPFTVNFEGREEKGLEEKLLSEIPGILNWAIEGLKRWLNEGLKPFPNAIKEATDVYKKDSDTVGQWLEKRTVSNPTALTQSSLAFNDYRDWCLENGYINHLHIKTFKASLEEKGYKLIDKRGANFWQGFEFPFALT